MNFELEPWEVPPGADAENLSVAIEFGPVDWQGEPTMVSARQLELPSGEAMAFSHLHAREINFFMPGGIGTHPPCLPERLNSKELGAFARAVMNSGDGHNFGRLFYLENEAFLIRNSKGHWTAPPNYYQNEYPLEIPFDTQINASAHLWHWLQNEWNKPNSAVRFAGDWARKDDAARQEYFAQTIPRWREIHSLMNAVARVVELPGRQRWILDHVDTHNHAPELLARLQPWRELISAHFPPFEPLPASKPEFLREYFRFASGHIQVQGAESSAHQQLEARLFLRAWLQHNAPGQLHLVE